MNAKSPVSVLQEILASKKFPLPTYYFEDVSEMQHPRFRCTATVNGTTFSDFGQNKKDAKQLCAKKALDFLQLSQHVENNNNNNIMSSKQLRGVSVETNYIGELNEYCSINNFRYPNYSDGIPTVFGFNVTCSFLDYTCVGQGGTKKAAKQDSAKQILERIKTIKITPKMRESYALYSENDPDKVELVLERYRLIKICDEKESLPKVIPKVVTEIPTFAFNNVDKISPEQWFTMYGIQYQIRTYQHCPLILLFEIKKENFVLMEIGISYDETKENLVRNALKMYQYKLFFSDKN